MPFSKKPYSAPDTERRMPAVVVEGDEPLAIDDAVVERFRRDSSRPQATADDVRREIVRNAIGPRAQSCPACRGTGLIDPLAKTERPPSPTTMLPPPADSTGELEPTVFQDEPTRPER